MVSELATQNRAWLRDKLEKAGLLPGLTALAELIRDGTVETVPPGVWSHDWARAYSDGHNNRAMRNGRLAHYASAYADICEETGQRLDFAAFYSVWEAGATFEGTWSEHWHFA